MSEVETTPDVVIPMGIVPTAEQQSCIDKSCEYLSGRSTAKPMFMTLGGLAGTGKTTIIKSAVKTLRDSNDQRAIVTAFTGKACDVLRRKGLRARTCHSILYRPILERGRLTGFDKLTVDQIRANEGKFDSIIVDESSMISIDLYKDLLALKVPILFVGDHGQLPPVGDSPNLMMNLTMKLETIHRQAADNPIIAFAHKVREGMNPSPNRTDDRLWTLPTSSLTDADLLWADQIIVAYNKQRHALNQRVRQLKGYTQPFVEGDRIICLKNDSQLRVFNGQQFTIKRILGESQASLRAELEFVNDEGNLSSDEFPIDKSFFGRDMTKEFRFQREVMYADYAYALTCHKFQGSETDKLVVYEQWSKIWPMSTWRYTAATRAAKNLRYYCKMF